MTKSMRLLGIFLFFCALTCGTIFATPVNPYLTVVLDKKTPYYTRAISITKINTSLFLKDIDSIYRFWEIKDTQGLTELEFNSLKNDLVFVVMRQRKRDERLAEQLVTMFSDKGHSVIWRDYCLQFMGRLLPESSLKDKKLIENALLSAIDDKDSGIAGAALIAINHNKSLLNIPNEQIDKKIIDILKSDAPDYVKTTVLQLGVMNQTNPQELMVISRKIIEKEKNVQLKTSALAALGEFGVKADLLLIKIYTQSSDLRLRTSALSAERKLSTK